MSRTYLYFSQLANDLYIAKNLPNFPIVGFVILISRSEVFCKRLMQLIMTRVTGYIARHACRARAEEESGVCCLSAEQQRRLRQACRALRTAVLRA